MQDCNERNLNVKKTFYWVGLDCPSKLNKPIKDMSASDEFVCIMSWILHKMPKREAATVRFKARGQAYQVKINHSGQKLHMNKPAKMKVIVGSILYDWQGEETYNTLTANKIRDGLQRADHINDLKKREVEREFAELVGYTNDDWEENLEKISKDLENHS